MAALALYNGSVLAEVFRAGILAVPRGQSEAAAAIGLSRSQTMRLILVPQAVRTMLPAIVTQCVVALKDTALGFIIAYPELLRTGQLIYNGFVNIIPTAIVVAAIYMAMNLLLSRLAIWLERRQSRVRRRRSSSTPPKRRRSACRAGSAGDLGGAGLADDGDPDLAGVGQLLLDLLGDVAGEHLRRRCRRRRPAAP